MCTEGMLVAERQCRKLRMGGISWSPKYQMTRRQIDFWNLLREKVQGGKVDSRLLIRKAKAAGLVEHLQDELPAIEKARTRIYQEYRRNCKELTYLRTAWLQKLGEAKAEKGLKSAEQEIKDDGNELRNKRHPVIRAYTLDTTYLALPTLL
jgi:hypothetical protein